MNIDVEGRVNNTTLAPSKPLLPLQEALVNSIQSIEDAKESKGQITIKLIRDIQQVLDKTDSETRAVTDIIITDNGIGFTEENFKSFNTSDTTFKKKRGGKGVGRFLWLVAFDEVSIDSFYADKNGETRRRKFDFIPRGDGIANHNDNATNEVKRNTTVRLSGFKKKYRSAFPKRAETIASHIAEHCLEFFINKNCPKITLEDPETESSLCINDLFERGMHQKSKSEDFEVKGSKFYMTHIRVYSTIHTNDHQAHYCANDRVVQSSKISKKIPNMTNRLEDEDGNKFLYATYVGSELLDESVNAERTGFAIDEDTVDILPDDVSWNDIEGTVEGLSKNYLAPYTNPIREQKRRAIANFVDSVAPMYKPILQYLGDRIDNIDPTGDDDELDIELYRAYHELEVETKEEGSSLFKEGFSSSNSFEEYESRVEAYFEKVADLKKSDLARYICQRKAVLDYLQKLLSQKESGKNHYESQVHDLIFPMGSTSNEVLLDGHNLWLLDEKLAYSSFLASDKQLRTAEPFDGKSQKEPDIIAYDKACAFSTTKDLPYRAITLVEFKRPMRNDYSEKDNPFVQLCEYMDLILENKAKTADGRSIRITQATPFYCYVVGDITPRMEKWAKLFNLDRTPEELGYFGYNKQYNAYFEVISYDKLVVDAQQRNAIFFEKLNLPSKIAAVQHEKLNS